MAKQLNVNLSMTADTSQAKAQLQQLQTQLTQLINSTASNTSGLGLTKDLTEAIDAASQLKTMLQQATTSSGKLDLGQFNQSLQKSGVKLSEYANKLNQLGPDGQKAFAQIAKSITTADVPIKKANTALTEFATTLKNTARWQISSSILHGFMGALQSAFNYAEDLNQSLTNIRIVTGETSEQMAEFAERANKAAQALSTTTTAYTDAALIFYQQGLDDDAVEKRTQATIKMAHATGDSATEVSSYMTAIWNNFDDGSESLEHYADVITALGASTASSSSEIASGLEKFASIAETTGLSYEYATSALATLVANTRQSADTVGTSLKTIFARLQGLSLGETLEDGTDLNKYSKALQTVGVDVLDTAGNMKDLDTILDDLADKWDNLTSAQQTALAQTVAGTRQYTQLMSLMNNWDDMETNLATANDSEGTLDKQADIYAESWEAARDRVTAAAESIYSSLINDDFFITALDIVEKLLQGVQNLIDGLGGLPGVLTTIGAIVLRVFGSQISESLSNTFYNLTYNTEHAKEEIVALRNSAVEAMKSLGDGSVTGSAAIDVFKQQGDIQASLIAKTEELRGKNTELTSEEQTQAQLLLDLSERLGDEAIAAAKVREEQEKVTAALEAQMNQRLKATADKSLGLFDDKVLKRQIQEAKQLQTQYGTMSKALSKMKKAGTDSFGDTADYATKLKEQLDNLGITLDDKVKAALENIGKVKSPEELEVALNQLETAVEDLGGKAQAAFDTVEKDAQTAFGATADNAAEAESQTQKFKETLNGVQGSATEAGGAILDQAEKLNNLGTVSEEAGNKINSFKGKTATFSDGVVALGSSLMSTAMAIQSIQSLGNIWADEDATVGEKILTTMTTLGMVVPMLTSAFSAQNIAKLAALKIDQSAIVTKLGLVTTEKLQQQLEEKGVGTKLASFAASKLEITGETGLTAAIFKKIAAQMLSNWYYAAAVAIILVLIGVIALLVKAYNADADAAKKANEEAQAAAEAAQDAQDKYDSLMDTIADYQDAKDALSTLTKGTTEWKEAVSKVNEQVLELMSSYKGLAKYVTNNDGVLEISDEGLQYLQDTQLDAVNQANMVAAQTQIKANNAQNKSDVTDTARSIGYVGYDGSYYNATSSEINKAVAAITDGGNAIFKDLDTFTAAMNEQGISNSSLISALYNNQDKLEELTTAVNNNTEANSLLEENIASTYLSDNSDYNNLSGSEQDAINKLVGNDAVDPNSQAYKDALSTYNSQWDSDIQSEYAQLMGWDTTSIDNKTGKGVYHLSDGTEYTVDDEVARAALAQADALEATANNLDQYVQNLQTIEQTGNQIASGLGELELGFAGGEGGSLTSGTSTQVSALSSAAGLSFDEDGKYVSTAVSDDTENEILSQWDELGYESAQAYADALGEAIEGYNTTEANIAENMGSETAEGFYKGIQAGLSDQSLDTKQAVANLLDTTFKTSGSDATDDLSQVFATAGDDAGELASIVSGIDWTSGNGAELLKTQLQDAGLSSYYASDAMQAFIAEMEAASTSAKNLISRFDELRSSMASIEEITGDIEVGSVISDEDYNTLIGYNSALEDMFMMTADGWEFVGSADELNGALETSVQDIDEMKAEFEDAATAAQRLSNWYNTGNGQHFDYSTGTYLDDEGNSTGEAVSDTMKASAISQWSQDDTYDAVFDQAGVSAEYAQELADYVLNATEAEQATDEYATKMAELNSIFTAAGTLQENYNNGVYDSTNAEELWVSAYVDNLTELQQAYNDGTISAETYDKALTDLAQNASSLEELQQIRGASLGEEGAGLSTTEYGDALVKLAENYSNCTEEIEDYNEALLTGDEDQINAAISALELSEQIGELAEKYDLDAEETENYSKRLAKSLGIDEKAASKLAVANERLDRGLSNLNDNLDDYKTKLSQNAKNSAVWSSTMDDLKTDMADLLNIADASMLSDDFAEATLNSEDLAAALDGDVDAIERLQTAAADDIMINIVANQSDTETPEQIEARWNQLKADFEATDISSPNVDQSQLLASFNSMIEAGNMTKDQIEAALSGLHVSANVKTTYIPQKVTVPQTITEEGVVSNGTATVQVPGPDGEWTTQQINLVKKITTTYDAGTTEVDGVVPQYEIEGTEGEGGITTAFAPAPSVTPSYSNTSSGKSSGGSGSGGGSSSSTPERKDKEHKSKDEIKDDYKKSDEEIERYHEINNTLDDIEDKVSKYNKSASRAFGGAKVKALKQEAAALKEEASAYQELYDEASAYLASDASKAKSYGWTFDSDGNVSNYDENMQALIDQQNAAEDAYLAEYNDAVDWWNSLTATQQNDDTYSTKFEDMTEAAQKTLDAANEAYDDAVEALSKYEETKEKQEEAEQKKREALEAALDAEIDAVDTVVQVKIEIDDDELKYLQELLDDMGDGADHAADAIANMLDQSSSLINKAESYTKGIEDILGVYTDQEALGDEGTAIDQSLINKIMDGEALDEDDISALANAGMTEDTISKLEDYASGLIDVNKELRTLRDESLEEAADAFSEYTDNMDRAAEKIEHLQKVTETYKDIIDIVGKKVLDASGELTNELNRANFNMQRNNTAALQSELDSIDSMIADQKKLIEQTEDEETVRQLNEQLKEMEDKRDSTYESWLESWEAECQAAADIYTETLEQIVSNFEDSIAGAMGSLSELSEEFDRKKSIADLYLDDYEQIYDLSKLTRDINKSIDDTDNIKSKKELKSLMEDIEQIQENGTKLSEYDVENLQKQYDLALAKAQLEEAQDAKSQVRMTRDAEGNYGYVYTADDSAVADAEQNYEDKLYAMQKANGDYIEELQSNIIQAEQDCSDAIAALNASDYASYEEYQAAVAQITADYSELINGYYDQLDGVLDNNQKLYNTEWTEYSAMTGYKISADEDYVDSFDETTLSLLTGFNDITTAENAWHEAVATALNDCTEAYYQWYQDTQTALSDGGTSIEDYGDKVDEVTEQAEEDAEDIAEEQEKLAEDYKNSYSEIISSLSEFCKNYDTNIRKIINSNKDLVDSINKVIGAAADLAENTDEDGNTKNKNTTQSTGDTGNTGTTGDTGDTTQTTSANNADKAEGVAAAIWMSGGATSGWGNGTERASKLAAKGVTGAQAYINAHAANGDIYAAWHNRRSELSKYYYGAFDTGGYTGDWGSDEGKLALLHSKELVLNAEDTENMLKAVELIREISSTIDLNALSASSGLASLLNSSSTVNNSASELQQSVTITAEFPNATDHSEIEEAFDNLINRAAQFANRKN